MSPRALLIASDHAGVEMKSHLIGTLPFLPWQDLGAHSTVSVDYPDYAARLAAELKTRGDGTRGILLCGSGQGMAIAANRYPFVRAALCWTEEVAELSRRHNDANVLCLASRLTPLDQAVRIVQAFLATEFEGGRHQKRIEKLCT